jgi:hypothetical protein
MITQELSGQVISAQSKVSKRDLDLIQRLPNPPLLPLTEDDIYVRRCRLAGEVIDSHGGCFRGEDLTTLLKLTWGAPTLIGHNRQTVGVGRFFGGRIEEHQGHRYIVPKFYWLKAHSKAEDLRVNIDGGIYSEASIAFTFRHPTCSICGEDIRSCQHWPGEEYDSQTCFFYYDGIDQVMEGSIVYRGATPGTGFLVNNDPPVSGLSRDWKGNWLRIKLKGRWHRAYLMEEKEAAG